MSSVSSTSASFGETSGSERGENAWICSGLAEDLCDVGGGLERRFLVGVAIGEERPHVAADVVVPRDDSSRDEQPFELARQLARARKARAGIAHERAPYERV